MKFVCPVCGFVEEFDGEELPADFKCPQCGVSGDRFTKVEEGKMTWAAEHIVGVAHEEGVTEDIIMDLRANFEGECSEVGMYLAMARVAHREGYPEIGRRQVRAGQEGQRAGPGRHPRHRARDGSRRGPSRQGLRWSPGSLLRLNRGNASQNAFHNGLQKTLGFAPGSFFICGKQGPRH